MDKIDRGRYKQLANDAIIAEFGSAGLTARLAEALEKCVEELEAVAECETCGYCDDHGDLVEFDDDDLMEDKDDK